jgi:Histidine kinase.
MKDNDRKYYFSIVKLFCIILLIIYFVYNSEKSLREISVEWFLLAVSLMSTMGFELSGSLSYQPEQGIRFHDLKSLIKMNDSIVRVICLSIEIMIVLLLILLHHESAMGYYLYPIALLDTIIFLQLPFASSFLVLFGVMANQDAFFVYIAYCLFLITIYFQNFMIIERYRKYLEVYEEEEYQLKDSIYEKDTIYKEQLEKSSLAFENRMLEEKSKLSQALHDKLGHSINGSIYQLEACKVLMEKDPAQSNKIIQGVIDNLRTSMDEIRKILRREKPDKKRMAYLQLVQLCAECKEKYGIHAEVTIEGENKEIPEYLWDIILDNTIESVTNALKYANCTELSIEIAILHKIIRCSIRDNGVGCSQLKEGMGIQGMKNRTRKVNGVLDINCESGFHINMIIPL